MDGRMDSIDWIGRRMDGWMDSLTLGGLQLIYHTYIGWVCHLRDFFLSSPLSCLPYVLSLSPHFLFSLGFFSFLPSLLTLLAFFGFFFLAVEWSEGK